MNLENDLAAAFRAKAETATTSPGALGLIRDRVRTSRRFQLLQIGAATLAVPAIAVAVFALNTGNDPAPLPPAGQPSVAATTTTGTSAPSSSAATPTFSSTPPATSSPPATALTPPATAPLLTPTATPSAPPAAYGENIAVGVRAATGDRVALRSPVGKEIASFEALPGQEINDLDWSPDRAKVYVSSTGAKPAGCGGNQATALDLATGKSTLLGEWGELAFSPDGRKLAYLDYAGTEAAGKCTGVTLVVRDLATDVDTRYTQAADSEPSGFSSLTWVPGVNRLVMVEQPPGDGTVVSLLNLDTAQSLKDLSRVDIGELLPGGEDARSLAYVGNRLIIATNCCLGTDETIRFLARDSATGKVTELRKQPGVRGGIAHLSVSPDGTRVVYSPYFEGSAWIWDFVGEPRKIADAVSGVAW